MFSPNNDISRSRLTQAGVCSFHGVHTPALHRSIDSVPPELKPCNFYQTRNSFLLFCSVFVWFITRWLLTLLRLCIYFSVKLDYEITRSTHTSNEYVLGHQRLHQYTFGFTGHYSKSSYLFTNFIYEKVNKVCKYRENTQLPLIMIYSYWLNGQVLSSLD